MQRAILFLDHIDVSDEIALYNTVLERGYCLKKNWIGVSNDKLIKFTEYDVFVHSLYNFPLHSRLWFILAAIDFKDGTFGFL